MSYLNNLSPQQAQALLTVQVSLTDFYLQRKLAFHQMHPNTDFSKASLHIRDTIFRDGVFSGDIQCVITFENCYFITDVTLFDLSSLKEFSFKQCFFDREIKIGRNVKLDHFDLVVATVAQQMIVDDGDFGDCKWSLFDNPRLLINGGSFKRLNIGYWGGSKLKELSFHFTKVQGLIRVTNEKTVIERLQLFQYASDVTVSFEDISVNAVSVYRYRNEKSLRFINVKSYEAEQSSEFAVVESFLGKAEFYSINFASFRSIMLLDAHLVECSFVNTKWRSQVHAFKGRFIAKTDDDNKLEAKIRKLESRNYYNIYEKNKLETDPTVIEYFEKKRESLRQLKYAMSKQGDIVNEQKFHGYEMVAHDRSLSWSGNGWTKFVLKLSRDLSDFGQSMGKPLGGLLIGHLILFTIIVIAGELPLRFSFDMTGEGFWAGIHHYFRLINPLRKADDTFEGGFILVDLAMRIWASYMIYNIVRASRRFIK